MPDHADGGGPLASGNGAQGHFVQLLASRTGGGDRFVVFSGEAIGAEIAKTFVSRFAVTRVASG